MEVGDGVVGDDVAGAVDFDGVVAGEQVGGVGANVAPAGAGPAEEAEAVVAAEEEVVGDVEIGGAGVFGPDAETDVFEAAVFDGEVGGAGEFLFAGKDGDVGVAEGEAVEDVVGGADDVEQDVVAGAVEDDLAVAGGLDGDGLVGGGFKGEVEGAIEGGGEGIDVVEALGAIEAGVDEDGIAGFGFAFPDDAPIAEACAVVGLEDAGEGGFLAGAFASGE